MKTPQEIARQAMLEHSACSKCLNAVAIALTDYAAAAREEGRREGVNSAIQIGRSPCPDRNCTAGLCPTQAEEIRALASQPKPEKDPSDGDYSGPFVSGFLLSKPEPAVTCEGCKRGLPRDITGFHWGKDETGAYQLPCTAKPEGGKRP